MITIKEITEEKDWHPEAVLPDIPFQQAFWYGEMQKVRGREVRRFVITRESSIIGYAQFIVYPLYGAKKYWYAAYGPILKEASEEILKAIKSKLENLASADAVFVRLDFSPALSVEDAVQASRICTRASKASSSGSYFQPRHEWYTDISKNPDEILSAMQKNTRYYVRFAEKKGVKIEISRGESMLSRLPQFLRLMKDTAKRNEFSLHDAEYYKCFFEEVAKRDKGFLIESKIGEQVLSTHFIVLEGKVAHYVFGASSDENKELCAPYLAQYSGMIEAKKYGAEKFNSGGVSVGDEAKHWAGVTAFKRKFGGVVFSHGAYFDIVIKAFWYYLYDLRKLVKKFI